MAIADQDLQPQLTENQQAELRILMSEKEQADKQIGSYLELQVKVHTVIFTAAAVATGGSSRSTMARRHQARFAVRPSSR